MEPLREEQQRLEAERDYLLARLAASEERAAAAEAARDAAAAEAEAVKLFYEESEKTRLENQPDGKWVDGVWVPGPSGSGPQGGIWVDPPGIWAPGPDTDPDEAGGRWENGAWVPNTVVPNCPVCASKLSSDALKEMVAQGLLSANGKLTVSGAAGLVRRCRLTEAVDPGLKALG